MKCHQPMCSEETEHRCEGTWCNNPICEDHTCHHQDRALCFYCASDQEEMEEDMKRIKPWWPHWGKWEAF